VTDERIAVYEGLHHGTLQSLEGANGASARIILSNLFERYRPKSVLDVGCGIGTWLEVAAELGVQEVIGVEGQWLDRDLARIPRERIVTHDLERPFDLQRRFDLAICLEVGEHLSHEAAPAFVESLVRHSDAVLFSAAIPLQGGDHHVNEQFPDYWQQLFGERGYVAVDAIRPLIWYSTEVLIWLRQNVVLFVKEELASGRGPFGGPPIAGPLSIVHPEVYASLAASAKKQLEDYNAMLEALSAGKVLSGRRNQDGSVSITISDHPAPP
jgi:SAM-dependent methyltransferase